MGRLQRLAQCSEAKQIMAPVPGVRRIVVCAANRYGTVVVVGPRHYSPTMVNTLSHFKTEVLEYMEGQEEEQGFIDQWGNFLNREEAMELVKTNGQPFNAERNGGDYSLFSEGLY